KEAIEFRLQEGQHAKCHRAHIAALVKRYPGLQKTMDDVVALYDELYEEQDIKFHLAFSGNLEATFTPFFKVIIDHRESLFGEGDSRVASLLLWHFCEEIEHRSAAMDIYQSVYGDQLYRMSIIPKVISFNKHLGEMILEGFKEHVPNLPEECFTGERFPGVPKREMFSMIGKLISAQMPWYNHDAQPLPEWANTWFEHYEKGEDMTNFYGVKPAPAAELAVSPAA
ncbi:MAG: metal-dependent hydrolase, partial [Gammaproteobacteria bacterium]|nr:metal-dependent hydrolase [Gammaproteobacteria bacterium]